MNFTDSGAREFAREYRLRRELTGIWQWRKSPNTACRWPSRGLAADSRGRNGLGVRAGVLQHLVEIAAQEAMDNGCACNLDIDYGVGASWLVTVPTGSNIDESQDLDDTA
jgi:hypothetical protein